MTQITQMKTSKRRFFHLCNLCHLWMYRYLAYSLTPASRSKMAS